MANPIKPISKLSKVRYNRRDQVCIYWLKTDPNGNVSIEFSNVLTKHDPVTIY